MTTERFESFQRKNPDETKLISDYLEAMETRKPKSIMIYRWQLGPVMEKLSIAQGDGLDKFELMRRLNEACLVFWREELGLELSWAMKNARLKEYRFACETIPGLTRLL